MLSLRVALAAAALSLAGCATEAEKPTPSGGTVEGSEFSAGAAGPTVGAVQGGLLGSDVGLSLDEHDRDKALQAEYEALEYGRAGQTTHWQGRDGTRGEVFVGALYEVNLLDCREYKHTVYIGGRPRVAHGTACRKPSGNWRVVE